MGSYHNRRLPWTIWLQWKSVQISDIVSNPCYLSVIRSLIFCENAEEESEVQKEEVEGSTPKGKLRARSLVQEVLAD